MTASSIDEHCNRSVTCVKLRAILWSLAVLLILTAKLGYSTPLRRLEQEVLHTDIALIGCIDRNGLVVDGNTAMSDLLNKYAPVIKLSSQEEYFPSSIKYMLDHYTTIEYENGTHTPSNDTLLTPSTLDQIRDNPYLSIAESHNPQPFLLDRRARYLYGPAGQSGGMKHGGDGRGIVEEDIYGFWVDQGKGVVDLWYWTFYPYNFGKPVGPFGVLGNHVGDWEHLRMRTINGTAVSVDYHSHNGGGYSAGTTRWEDVHKVRGRPVAYSAAGSHGLWPTPGDHVLATVLDVFKLVDLTDDEGAIWDTQDHVVPAQYWDSPVSRRKIWHRGEESWLGFRGRWGNKGESDCWWFKLVGICQLVDAPPGPNRWFGTPPDCIIAPLSWETSTYSFYLSFPLARAAEDRGVSIIQVEQVCARPRRKKDDGDDGDDDDDDDDDGDDGDGDDDDVEDVTRIVDYIHDDTREEDLEMWTISGSTAFKGIDQHTVSMLPCNGKRSAVKSYRISLCLGDGKCVSTSSDRKICSYETGKKGYRFGNAVNVDDIDEWRWNI